MLAQQLGHENAGTNIELSSSKTQHFTSFSEKHSNSETPQIYTTVPNASTSIHI